MMDLFSGPYGRLVTFAVIVPIVWLGIWLDDQYKLRVVDRFPGGAQGIMIAILLTIIAAVLIYKVAS